MTESTELTLTARERVLLHLQDYIRYNTADVFPVAITQKGISDITGVRLSHVPRTLKGMVSSELVSVSKGHVKGERRRYNAYFLTKVGLEEAKHLLENVTSLTIQHKGQELSFGDILEKEKGPIFPLLMELVGGGLPGAASRRMAGDVPVIEDLVGRADELDQLKHMLEHADPKMVVVYGSLGYGTTALAAKFVSEAIERWSVCWVQIRKELGPMLDGLMKSISELNQDNDTTIKDAPSLAQALSGRRVILVCDGYFDVSDEVVELFTGLVSDIKGTEDLKILITAREDTPSYNRFYTILDIDDGTVSEVHIRGLDMEHCREMLDTPDIHPDALRRLYLFTRGCPTTLKLLAAGNENELREKTKFLPEEIKLMLFLKGQKEG